MNDFEAVRQLISSTTGMDAADIKPDSDLAEFGLGKLDFTELLNELEDTFDIEIDMEYIIPENFNSAEAMWKMIERLQDE